MTEIPPSQTATAEAPAPDATAVPTTSVEPTRTQATVTPAESDPPAPQPGATPTVPHATPAAAPTQAHEKSPSDDTSDADEKDRDDEPQNALTSKFTKAEWDALRAFRATLPTVFADAFPDRPDAGTTAITMWGVTIDPAHPAKDARVSVVLMKFLRARNLSPTEAKDMLISTLRWRESFGVDAALREDFPQDVFGGLGHVYGKDREGRPVTYNLYGANKDLDAVFGDVQRFLRWRVAFMERSIALLDFETVDQMVQIHDYEGVSMSSRTTNSKNAAAEASSIFQGHYPEFLSRKFFINVPTFLTWIFWLFKPLLSSATLAKMSVVGSGPRAIGAALGPVIEEGELPRRYGGSAEGF
ncbi:CRAL/TRIO domain-containing protein [Leucogyrophana mollusca]|uniref:CRAL/TRIO domain-containing protein n=1 Tax=Leucogyrophana mollusca TaxID=85980 RepID=A0ACB8B412_9AGAM|nr:CRAL/TRIO domain-containing protein [Leucogyrophana mollusca]